MILKVIGKGSVGLFSTQDQGIHKPGPQQLWQESVAQVWWDPTNGIGGFYRLGHETNDPTGAKVAMWSTTYSPREIFKHDSYLPLRRQDRNEEQPMWFGSGDDRFSYQFDGNPVWTFDDQKMSLELKVHDYHEQIDCYPKSDIIANFAPAHIEVAGTMSGTLKMKNEQFDIQGYSVRDRGWGERQWSSLVSHRWTVGAFGPDLSFCAVNWHSSTNQFMNFGWIVRGHEITYAEHLDFIAYVEADGLSTRGGRLVMKLTTGETLNFEFEGLAPSAISFLHGIACVDTLSRVRCGDRIGYGCFETTHNAQYGQNRPLRAINGVLDNGWHDRGRKDVAALMSSK